MALEFKDEALALDQPGMVAEQNPPALIDALNKIKIKNDPNWKDQCVKLLQENNKAGIVDAYLKYIETLLPESYAGADQLKFKLYVKNSIGILSPSELSDLGKRAGVILPKHEQTIKELNDNVARLREYAGLQNEHVVLQSTVPEILDEMEKHRPIIGEIVDAILRIEHQREGSGLLKNFGNFVDKKGEWGAQGFVEKLKTLKGSLNKVIELYTGLKGLVEAGGDYDAEFSNRLNAIKAYVESCKPISALLHEDVVNAPDMEKKLTQLFLPALLHAHRFLVQPETLLTSLIKLHKPKSVAMFHDEACSNVALVCMASFYFQVGNIKAGNALAAQIHMDEKAELDESEYFEKYQAHWKEAPEKNIPKLINLQKLHMGRYFVAQMLQKYGRNYPFGPEIGEHPFDQDCRSYLFGLRCLYEAAFEPPQDEFSSQAFDSLRQYESAVFSAEEVKGEEKEPAGENLQQKYAVYIAKLDCYLKVVSLREVIPKEDANVKDKVLLSPEKYRAKLSAYSYRLQALNNILVMPSAAYVACATAIKVEFDQARRVWESRLSFLKEGCIDDHLEKEALSEYVIPLERWVDVPRATRDMPEVLFLIDPNQEELSQKSRDQIRFCYARDEYYGGWNNTKHKLRIITCHLLTAFGESQQVDYTFRSEDRDWQELDGYDPSYLFNFSHHTKFQMQYWKKKIFLELAQHCLQKEGRVHDNQEVPYPPLTGAPIQRLHTFITHTTNRGWIDLADRAKAALAVYHFSFDDAAGAVEGFKFAQTIIDPRHVSARHAYAIGESCLKGAPDAEHQLMGLRFLHTIAHSQESIAEGVIGDGSVTGDGATVGGRAMALLLRHLSSQAAHVVEGDAVAGEEQKDADYKNENIERVYQAYRPELERRIPWEKAFGPGSPFANSALQIQSLKQGIESNLGAASSARAPALTLQRMIWTQPPVIDADFPEELLEETTPLDTAPPDTASQDTSNAEASTAEIPSQVVLPLKTSPQAALTDIQADCARLSCIFREAKHDVSPLLVEKRAEVAVKLIGKVSSLHAYLSAQLEAYSSSLLARGRLWTGGETKQRNAFYEQANQLRIQLGLLQTELQNKLQALLAPPSAPFLDPAPLGQPVIDPSAPPEDKRDDEFPATDIEGDHSVVSSRPIPKQEEGVAGVLDQDEAEEADFLEGVPRPLVLDDQVVEGEEGADREGAQHEGEEGEAQGDDSGLVLPDKPQLQVAEQKVDAGEEADVFLLDAVLRENEQLREQHARDVQQHERDVQQHGRDVQQMESMRSENDALQSEVARLQSLFQAMSVLMQQGLVAPASRSASATVGYSPRFLAASRAAPPSEAVGSQVDVVVERGEGGEPTVSSSSVSS